MIDEETVEFILRKIEEWGTDNAKKLEKCGEHSQTYKHGYREGYKDCLADLADNLEDIIDSEYYSYED